MQECPSFVLRASETGEKRTLPHNCSAAAKNDGGTGRAQYERHAGAHVARRQGTYRGGVSTGATQHAQGRVSQERVEEWEIMRKRIVGYILPGGSSARDLLTWAAGVAFAQGWEHVEAETRLRQPLGPFSYEWFAGEVQP